MDDLIKYFTQASRKCKRELAALHRLIEDEETWLIDGAPTQIAATSIDVFDEILRDMEASLDVAVDSYADLARRRQEIHTLRDELHASEKQYRRRPTKLLAIAATALEQLMGHLSYFAEFIKGKEATRPKTASVPATVYGDFINGPKNISKIKGSKVGAAVVGERGQGTGAVDGHARTTSKKTTTRASDEKPRRR